MRSWPRTRPLPPPLTTPTTGDAGSAWDLGLRARSTVRWFTSRPPVSLWVGLGILVGFGGVAIASLILFRNAGTYLPQNAVWAASVYPPGPSWAHPFGVLHGIVGIDLLQAMVRATPWDLAIVGAILLLALSIGLLLGGIAGGSGSTTTDIVVTSWTDAIAGVPPFFLVFVVFLPIATLVPVAWSLPVFVLSFGFVLWPYHARLVRAQAREVREEPFVESARASGSGRWSIVRRHILPNSYRAVLTQVPADVASIFFVLTVFPFAHCFDSDPRLGDYLFPLLTPLPNPGPSYPAPFFPEWGNLLAQGVCFGYQISWPSNQWWLYFFPLLTIVVFAVGVSLFCDGLLPQDQR